MMRKLVAVLLLAFAVLSYGGVAVAQQGWIQTQIVSGVLSIPSYRMVLWAQKNAALTRAEEDANWLSGLGVYVTISADSSLCSRVSPATSGLRPMSWRYPASAMSLA